MTDTHSAILNEADAASILGVEPRTVRLWRRTRGLPYYKLTGKIVRFKHEDLLRWIEKHRVAMRG